jgi:hypothetical protein
MEHKPGEHRHPDGTVHAHPHEEPKDDVLHSHEHTHPDGTKHKHEHSHAHDSEHDHVHHDHGSH